MAGIPRTTRRVDSIRQRRTVPARKAAQPATAARRSSRSATRSAERGSPPVMVRSTMAGLPLRESKHTRRTKRRYDMALGVPGAEIRLPSLPQVSIGWRWISFILVAILGGLLYHVWNSPMYRVEAAEITGLQRLTEGDVEAVLGVSGSQIFSLDPALVGQDLKEAFPEFASIEVKVGLPDKLFVTVSERQPVLIWRQEGRTELVDAQGIAFPLRDGAEAGELPVVDALTPPPSLEPVVLAETGLAEPADGEGQPDVKVTSTPKQLLTAEMVSGVLAMAAQAPQNTPLVYDAQHGLGWKDPRGWEAYFGDARDMGMKLNVYTAIIQRLEQDQIQPALVSVEYVHAPYYRIER